MPLQGYSDKYYIFYSIGNKGNEAKFLLITAILLEESFPLNQVIIEGPMPPFSPYNTAKTSDYADYAVTIENISFYARCEISLATFQFH